jgi:L,D-peptidoglycan transpeptidase YkuD (ErfK/YbiS/YcfS/YnhG family)
MEQRLVRQTLRRVHVRAINSCSDRGLLAAGNLRLPARLGRGGVSALKREGDGATPRGVWFFTGGLWRADRIKRPASAVPFRILRRWDGWCDAPGDRNYNRRVAIPYPASHEALWREDRLYDIVLTLSHNTRSRVRGHGSAVFAHLAGEGPTAGCVALSLKDMRKLLRWIGPGTSIVIG